MGLSPNIDFALNHSVAGSKGSRRSPSGGELSYRPPRSLHSARSESERYRGTEPTLRAN